MGYTHYWKRKVKINHDKETWNAFIQDVKKVVKWSKVNLGDHEGENEPVINKNHIALNGKGKNLHESFILYCKAPEQPDYRKDEDIIFEFCKTERKPYDIVVIAILLLYKYYFFFDVTITSDGDSNDWKPGADLAFHVTGLDLNFKNTVTRF